MWSLALTPSSALWMPAVEDLDMSDKWVLSELNKTARDMTANMDSYDMGLAAAKIQNFIWDVYCDWYIEICKSRLNGGDEKQADVARKVLVYVLDRALRLLHPIMPFVTEEIYQALPGSAETIMNQSWPVFDAEYDWPEECADFETLELVVSRNGRHPYAAYAYEIYIAVTHCPITE